MALTRGADHTREDLLGPCAAGRPIPATDLAIDDGGADGVFSAPVGRVDVGGPQEGEHSRELTVEMPGEALGRRQSGRRVDEPAQAGKQAPAGPSEALLGDRVGIPPIAEREGVGEDGLHAGCPRAPRMVGTERATPAEQMCQAALVQRAGEAAIGRPSVADQHTGEVRAQDRDRIVKATPGADRIHGGLRCRERPQPVQHGTDAPASFIRTDDGTPPDLSAESRVRGRRYPGRAMQDLSKSSRRDRQPEPVLQQCCDLLQRHAHVFVQQDRKRHGARTELYACRAQGVGGLQRVPALHAVPACDAAPDLNVEPPHDWLDDGQVFLVLGRDASGLNRPTTARARHGKRRGIRLIHPRRNRSPAATSIGGTCPPARSPAATLRAVLRKRGGLSKARAPRCVELLLETLASSLPSIAIACRAGQLLTQAGNLILVALDQLVAFVARRSRALVGHACVMSYPRKLYKPNSLDLLPSPAKRRRFLLLWVPIQGWVQLNLFNDSSATVLIYEFQIIGIYLVFGTRALRASDAYGPPKTVWLAVPFVLWVLALIPWSVATNGSLLTAIGLRSLLLPLPLVWIGYRAFENRRQLENVGKLLMLEVAVVAWVTAFQFSQVTATSLTGTMSELALGFSNVGVVRPPGTFSAPGHLGMYVLVSVPFAIGLLGLSVTFRTRVIYAIGLAGAMITLMVNTQRATIVLLTVTLPLVFLLARKLRAIRNGLIALCVLGAGGVVGAQIAGGAFAERVGSISVDAQATLITGPTSRMAIALQNPVIGEGLGIASPGAARLFVPLGGIGDVVVASVRPSESFMASLVYETGIPGLFLFFLFMAALMVAGVRSVRACRHTDMGLLAAAFVGFQVTIWLQSWSYDPLHFPPSRVMFWFLAGVLLSLPRLAATAAVPRPAAMPLRASVQRRRLVGQPRPSARRPSVA